VTEPEASPPVEPMRLRQKRPPVTRLSRKVLLGLGVVATAGVAGALIFALAPRRPTTGSELYNTSNRTTPDGLTNLRATMPGSRAAFPKLGPPLPGDLGRPIANADSR
jgi:type IV secretion system protein TrbI